MPRRRVDNLDIIVLHVYALAFNAPLVMALKLLHGSRVARVDMENCARIGNALGALAGSEVAEDPVTLEQSCYLPERGAEKHAKLTLIRNLA